MSDKVVVGKPGWEAYHVEQYLKTDGANGHFVDFTIAGGPAESPCLILKTTGRRSGEARLTPLIYGEDGGRFVLVASKGGAPAHPAWFLNLQATPEVAFQVLDRKYRARASVAEGAERERLYAMMAKVYPPYIAYQAGTSREIPVVVLEPLEAIDRL